MTRTWTDAQVLGAILAAAEAHGRPPTLRELSDSLGAHRPSKALWYCNRLRARGVLHRDRRIAFTPPAHEALARIVLGTSTAAAEAAALLAEGDDRG